MGETILYTSGIPAMNPEKAGSSNRLEALIRIIREVDSAPDLDSALSVIVRRTREVMAADVCTVYFTDHEQRHHVFAATDGLSADLVGQVKAGFGRGLIGQVADSSRPVNLAEVPEELDQEFLHSQGAIATTGFSVSRFSTSAVFRGCCWYGSVKRGASTMQMKPF